LRWDLGDQVLLSLLGAWVSLHFIYLKGEAMSIIDTTTPFHDVQTNVLRDNDENNFTIKHSQHIPQEFLDRVRKQREDSLDHKEKDYMTVASVPVSVHEKWLREGFDMLKEPAFKILARLRQEDLDAFITTKKKV
tara:strand:- start:552 stop:956 length:405 start_codon:yes stop_codon:yes gene_type:complete